jgi:hypothetical protein
MNTEKKQWVAPVATEMEVNGGSIIGFKESIYVGPSTHGTIS